MLTNLYNTHYLQVRFFLIPKIHQDLSFGVDSIYYILLFLCWRSYTHACQIFAQLNIFPYDQKKLLSRDWVIKGTRLYFSVLELREVGADGAPHTAEAGAETWSSVVSAAEWANVSRWGAEAVLPPCWFWSTSLWCWWTKQVIVLLEILYGKFWYG